MLHIVDFAFQTASWIECEKEWWVSQTFAVSTAVQRVDIVTIKCQAWEVERMQNIAGMKAAQCDKKCEKKVSWRNNLTDVKVITPPPGVFDNITEIVWLEEEEDNLMQDEDPSILLKSCINISDNPRNNLDNCLQSTQKKDRTSQSHERFTDYFPQNDQFSKTSECMSGNQGAITGRKVEEKRRKLDVSLQQILGSKPLHVNVKKLD